MAMGPRASGPRGSGEMHPLQFTGGILALQPESTLCRNIRRSFKTLSKDAQVGAGHCYNMQHGAACDLL